MKVSNFFSCLDSSSNLLGYCLVYIFSESAGAGIDKGIPKQYYLNTYVRGYDAGSNPFNMMKHPCDGVKVTEMTENINALLTEGLIPPINTDEVGNELQVFNGLMVSLSEGDFYFIKVPYGTKIVDNGTIRIELQESTKTTSYIFISTEEDDVQFGEGLLTTREYLINNEYIPKVEAEAILQLLPPIKGSGFEDNIELIGSERKLLKLTTPAIPGIFKRKGNLYSPPRESTGGYSVFYQCIQDTWIEDPNKFCAGTHDNFYFDF